METRINRPGWTGNNIINMYLALHERLFTGGGGYPEGRFSTLPHLICSNDWTTPSFDQGSFHLTKFLQFFIYHSPHDLTNQCGLC